jgi:3-hydroxybutyryl-CoA dehydratase
MPVRAIRSLAFEDLTLGQSELVFKTVIEQDIGFISAISMHRRPASASASPMACTRPA